MIWPVMLLGCKSQQLSSNIIIEQRFYCHKSLPVLIWPYMFLGCKSPTNSWQHHIMARVLLLQIGTCSDMALDCHDVNLQQHHIRTWVIQWMWRVEKGQRPTFGFPAVAATRHAETLGSCVLPVGPAEDGIPIMPGPDQKKPSDYY